MTTDNTTGVSLRHVGAILGAVLLMIVPTGAAMVNSGVVDFLGEESGLTLSRADGPNGQYVQFDAENQLTVNISTNGVNLDSKTRFDRVFVVNNTGEELREVWVNHTNSEILSLYDSDTRRSIGFEERVTLAPGERIEVGILVDTTGSSMGVGGSVEMTLTVHSRGLTPEDGPVVGVPNEVAFGNVTNGTVATKPLTIDNDGGVPLAIVGLSIGGIDGESFRLSDPTAVPDIIAPGESATVQIEASPGQPRLHSATLSVSTNDTETPTATVALTAQSVPVELTAASGGILAYGEVVVDTADQQSATVRNDGATTVRITDTILSGPDAEAFTVVEAGVRGDLAPGESVTIPVIFGPEETGQHRATLRIRTASDGAASVDLLGTGIIPGDIAVDPSVIDFGDVGKNEHAEATLTVSNDGERPLALTGVSVRGADADQFSVEAGSAETTLDPGESRTITVSFDPTRDGELIAELRVTSDDPDTPVRSVPLVGTSVPAEIGLDPEDLDFGNVTVGNSKTLEVDVWNDEDSLADLEVGATTIVGRDPEAFEVTAGAAPFVLAPGERKTIEVTYSPETAGIKTAQLRVLSDGSERQIDVWMSNTGWRIRVQEVEPGKRGIDADEETFQLDTGKVRSTATNVEVDANDLPADVEVTLNVSTPGTRNRPVGMEEVSFRTRLAGTFDMNFVHDDEPPLPDSTRFAPPSGRAIAQYITLWHSVDTEAFEQPSLVYQIKRSNLEPGTDPDEVVFRRFSDGEWTSYEATLLRETQTHYVYRVSLPGFSEFVVTAPTSEEEGSSGGGPGGDGGTTDGEAASGGEPHSSETPTDGGSTTQGGVEVAFDESGDGGEEESGITVTELDDVPGANGDEGPLAVIDRRTGGGDADTRIESTQRSAELQERIRAAGADALVEVNQPIELSGSLSVIRAANGVDGRGQIVRAVDVSVPEHLRSHPATIRLVVDRERFGDSDPALAQIGHYTGTGWELLETSVVSTSEESVLVEARTPGFSPFAVFADNQVRFVWELPDETTHEGQSIEPTFGTPGFHEVTLTVTDAFGRSDSASYRVLANDRPEVEIAAPAQIEPGEPVTLVADVTDEVGNVTVTWSLPDGTERTGRNVTTSFEAGDREVRAIATDEFGASGEASRTLVVGPSFGTQQLRSMAANMPFEAQVLLSFLIAVTITFAATRPFDAGRGGWLRMVRVPTIPSRRTHLPEIVTFADVALDEDAAVFEVEALTVTDPDGDLRSIVLEVRDARDIVVARKLIELDDEERYEAQWETIPALSRAYLARGETFEVQITAVDARGDEAQSTLSIGTGGD